MKVEIYWIKQNVIQIKELVKCRTTQGQFTIYSPIYKAIENGSFVLDLGEFGKHPFTITLL